VPKRRPPDPVLSSLVVGLTSLALMPVVPILPGLGSLLALILALLALRGRGRRWLVAVAILVSGGGLVLVVIQLAAALVAALQFSPG
jgi:hypothetical protein